MITAGFEGYTGTNLHSISLSNDIMICIVLLLFTGFASIFRLNIPLFEKMLSNINAGEQRQSIFESTEKDSFLFNSFMTFQTLLLFSIFLLAAAVKYNYISNPNPKQTLCSLGLLYVLFFAFYMFKKGIYEIFGRVFIEPSAKKTMFTNYQAIFGSWGVALYLPVFCILLFSQYFLVSAIILVISYLVFRAVLIFRFSCIYLNKNTGFLVIMLYLCAQEIVPLVFLYEGMVYTYNMIEKSNTWQ